MTSVSAARPGRGNEDFIGAVPAAAVLTDGAGIPGAEATCRHGVGWYATHLGTSLLTRVPESSLEPPRALPTLLAEAITEVTDAHRATCAVADPVSPSATVAMLRVAGDLLDYLVLGDTVLVLDRAGTTPLVVSDPREVVIAARYETLLAGTDQRDDLLRQLRAHRNAPGGFWLAKDDPRAAAEAVTGSCPVAGLAGAVLLSNGASRLVDRFALTDWPGLLAVLARAGPAAVTARVRQAEARLGVAPDDASIVYCTDLGRP